MMNQSEIDAGPPNKKPKIGSNVGSTSVVNGLSTQMSETSDNFFFDLPDELVSDNNDFSSQPPQTNSVTASNNNGLIDSGLGVNNQQNAVGPQSQIKQQIQFKIINGTQQQQQQQQNSQPHLTTYNISQQQVTNSPNRGSNMVPQQQMLNNNHHLVNVQNYQQKTGQQMNYIQQPQSNNLNVQQTNLNNQSPLNTVNNIGIISNGVANNVNNTMNSSNVNRIPIQVSNIQNINIINAQGNNQAGRNQMVQPQNNNSSNQQANLNIQRPPSQSSPLINSNLQQQPHDPNTNGNTNTNQSFDQLSMMNQNQGRFINSQQQSTQQQSLNQPVQQTGPNTVNNNNTSNTNSQQFNQNNQQIRQVGNPQQMQQQQQQQRQQMPQQQQQQQALLPNAVSGAPVSVSAVPQQAGSTTTGNTNLGTVNEQEKRKLIQQQLVLLLHAHKCSQRTERQCIVPHCGTMRNVLSHMTQCNEGRNCREAHCASSRQIIAHWKNCIKPDCPVCNPLRANNQNNRPNNANVTNSPNNAANIVTNNNNANNPALLNNIDLSKTNGPMANPSTAQGTNPNTANNNSNTPNSQQQRVIILQQQPQQPSIHKAWHENITNEMRKHLVQKIIQTIFPTQDHNIYKDPRLANLVGYAVKTECEMYEQAKDQEEYFHLLAERIYKIQKEFEDKQKTRNLNKNLATVGAGSGQLMVGGGVNNSTGSVSANDLANTTASSQQGILSGNMVNGASNQTIYSQLQSLNHDQSAPPNKIAPSELKKTQQFNGNMQSNTNNNLNNNNSSNLNNNWSLDSFQVNPNNTKSSSQPFENTGGQQVIYFSSLKNHNSKSHVNGNLLNINLQHQQQGGTNSGSSNGNFQRNPSLVGSTAAGGGDGVDPKIVETYLKEEVVTSSNNETGSGNNVTEFKQEIKSETDTFKQEMKFEIKKESTDDPTITAKLEIKSETETSASSESAAGTSSEPSSSSTAGGSTDPAAEPTSKIATTFIGANKKAAIKFPAEYLKTKLMPTFDRVWKETEASPFHYPVNPEELGLPDYFNVVKKPMDLSTIRTKLEEGKYLNPMEFVDDMWLMFNNAWLYNKKTSKVYKYCTKLAEVFGNSIDAPMKEMGYCCGQQYTFSPQVLFCYGNSMCCTIPKDGSYFLYSNPDQSRPNLNCDKYTYCIKCFEGIKSDTVPIGDDPNATLVEVKKSLFTSHKNDFQEPENIVDCAECGRRWHQICALHMEQIFSKFTCDTCVREKAKAKENNRYTSSKLMRTQLGDFLENKVNNFLKQGIQTDRANGGGFHSQAGKVTIRILSQVDKSCEIRANMKSRYEGECRENFPFRTKAIFAFEEIDGTDVCFFGMHVQEYGSECGMPNTRRVYISYLDSVFFFRPKELRTAVYHEILIGYLDYVKRLGYQWAHIWACPPSEGDDYIFHCHPAEQKVPKPKRLQDWYKKMLDKGIIERVVIDYKDIHKDAIENGMKTPLDIPYFEGDFWPNILEDCIKECEQEEEKRRKEEAEALAAANDDFSAIDDTYDDGSSKDGLTGQNGKKKSINNQQKKKNMKNKLSQRKSAKKLGSSSDLMTKILGNMEKHKEVFFVIRLLEVKQVAQMGAIVDKDPTITCDLMNGRDEFLNFAKDKHHEFSTLRRAKYSTMALLYELHNQGNEKFVYTCNTCRAQMESRYHCTVCEDFDQCAKCNENKPHEHKMEFLTGAETGSNEGKNSKQAKNAAGSEQNKPPKPYIELYLNTFMHAVNCRNANCTFAKCMQFKRVVQHSKQCQKFKNSQCEFCRQLIALCIYHAKSCKDDMCQVPLCGNIKIKLKQQKALNHQAERRRMLMMNKTLRQSANHSMMQSQSSQQSSEAADESKPAMASTGKKGGPEIKQQQQPFQQQQQNTKFMNQQPQHQQGHGPQQMQQTQLGPMNQYGHQVQHHQPTITINLPSSHTLQHSQQQQHQQQQFNIVNQAQPQQGPHNNPNNPHFNQQQPGQYNQGPQQQQQQHQMHQQQQQHHNTSLNNPINNSPQHGNYQQGNAAGGYSQGNANNLSLNHMTPQSPGHVNSNIQHSQMMNSPGKAQYANQPNSVYTHQPGQPQAIVNRQQILQQQQPSPSGYQGPGGIQQPRIISQITQGNIAQVSPHPTPTGTPNPMFNDTTNANDNTSQQATNWQSQQNPQQNQNSQFQNPMLANRINTPINVGSPVTNTSSPSPSLNNNSQTASPYQQQFQQSAQIRPQMQQTPPGGVQPQPQQPANSEYLQQLVARFKQASTPAEKNAALQEIRQHAPHIYQKIIALQQQQMQQQQQQMNSNNVNNTNNPQQQANNQNSQQWSGYNQQQPGNNQYGNQPQQPQQIRYNNPNMQQQPIQRLPQQQPIVLQPQQQQPGSQYGQQQNPQLLQQQRLQQQQQLQHQQRLQMQQQQQGMRPVNVQQNNVYIQNQSQQQGQQQGHPQMMVINNQGHYQQQQQDPQMMNQTKDQMLLQAGGPNKMHMSQQGQANSQNPTDKLSQVVDDL